MEKITAKEFLRMISENPSVFEHWDTPLEITGFVNCKQSSITHLSKHLTFSGKNQEGEAANFAGCQNLKTATGTFHGFVYFANSSVETIENLLVTEADILNLAASFFGCPNLKTASGKYAGWVTFGDSGIHSIRKLNISHTAEDGNYASFENCPNLTDLSNWDLSKKIKIEFGKLADEKIRRKKELSALQKFHKENQIEELPFL
jgi:hypothetical protein